MRGALTPRVYKLEGFDHVDVCQSLGYSPWEVAVEHHKPPYWYLYNGGSGWPYWRSTGWCLNTPAQFKTAKEAAEAYIAWYDSRPL